MIEEKTSNSLESKMLRLASVIGVKKSRIAVAENNSCFRKSQVLQDLAEKQRTELVEMERELETLRQTLGLPIHKKGASGSERRKRKRLKRLIE